MTNVFKAVMLVGLVTVLQACATANVGITSQPSATPPKFERVSVLPFDSKAGAGIPATAEENIAGAIIAKLQKDHPGLFREVTSTSSNDSGELIVKGKILKYDPGSKAARFILIGLGAGALELDVTFVNGGTGEIMEQFSTSGSIVAGGVAGASMGIDDMINSAAGKIVERLAIYGPGGGKQAPK